MKAYTITFKLDKTVKIEARSKAWAREKVTKDLEDGRFNKDIQIKIKEA